MAEKSDSDEMPGVEEVDIDSADAQKLLGIHKQIDYTKRALQFVPLAAICSNSKPIALGKTTMNVNEIPCHLQMIDKSHKVFPVQLNFMNNYGAWFIDECVQKMKIYVNRQPYYYKSALTSGDKICCAWPYLDKNHTGDLCECTFIELTVHSVRIPETINLFAGVAGLVKLGGDVSTFEGIGYDSFYVEMIVDGPAVDNARSEWPIQIVFSRDAKQKARWVIDSFKQIIDEDLFLQLAKISKQPHMHIFVNGDLFRPNAYNAGLKNGDKIGFIVSEDPNPREPLSNPKFRFIEIENPAS